MELKSCPFCGGEAHLRQYYDYEDKISYCYVYCNCGARTSVYMRKQNAIRAWNKRPNHWHTGTPTEEGWYLFKWHDDKECWFTIEYLTLEGIKKKDEWHSFDNCKWQKIEDKK